MDPLRRHRDREPELQALLALIRDARFSDGVRCPRCGSRRVHRWGRFSGRQRYRCRGACGRTFSDLTGTPAAYIKKILLWPAYARCMEDGISLRSASGRLGVHVTTAFRWRHRILAGLEARDRVPLTGWIELGIMWIAESRKGDRHLDRPPRRHGIPSYWLRVSPDARRVLIACDRLSHVASTVLSGAGLTTPAVSRFLTPRMRQSTTLVAAEGVKGPTARLARSLGASYRDARRGRSTRRPTPDQERVHVRTTWAYLQRLKRWMARFRGVATRHLPNYLAWHRGVDEPDRRRLGMSAFEWPPDRPALDDAPPSRTARI